MKRPGFLHGAMAAAVLGFIGAAFITVFTLFAGAGLATRLVVPMLALAYLLYLFTRNDEKTGRVTTLVLWSAMTVATGWFAPPLPFYLLIHAAAIWLVRSLYFYSGVLPSLMDMALTGLSLVTSIWALSRTGSVFLGTWCFFLVQALFTAIPRSIGSEPVPERLAAGSDFEHARRQADAALRQLMTR